MLQSLSDTLFSQYRRRVLGLLLLRPEASYHVREIARLTGTAPGTLHKEPSKLAEAGILTRTPQGNQVLYRANRASPVFEELAGIMRKTSGAVEALTLALAPVAASIQAAFIFGSVAAGRDVADSDIDVAIIGSITFRDSVQLLYPVQSSLAREINAKVFSAEEWQSLVQRRDPFVVDVVAKPKLFLIGNDDDLGESAGTEP
ncbi:transcriptional regulator, ArsR family [Cupriavidus sp. OV038]|uniref:DNA polymerase subunit beta n=1 Tax=unclassified Cupriavidus TaxID=2640874 RepID=UPI0008E01CC6|nr:MULTISPECIES: DNA polymerase subunit beta [unclassified Cupriavidus]SFC98714.1 transcriptional regulator, ArsR family [Cupriavidus sp. OV038]SFP62724.1 transcriptional regulator, ArsR family [Cupriavidus sp. OV096]